ncbi:hypothetical protein WA026_007007 [Henosepilachna vigintioctopunctata]|uniref:Uncharacterized protein n=1 Tax=Henosepilachna vigintioctopunctata TaxID=420089 RepID=A0AAW1V1R1_9CUCU
MPPDGSRPGVGGGTRREPVVSRRRCITVRIPSPLSRWGVAMETDDGPPQPVASGGGAPLHLVQSMPVYFLADCSDIGISCRIDDVSDEERFWPHVAISWR